jgi:hypothetical protein
MKNANSYLIRATKWASCLLLLAALFMAQPSLAQTSGDCGCQDQVNVTLGEDCTFALTLAQVGAGDCEGLGYRVVVNDRNPSDNIVDCAGLYTYGIFDSEDELICWGEVLAEDKTAPIVDDYDQKEEDIECVYIDDLVNNENSIDDTHPLYIGNVFF